MEEVIKPTTSKEIYTLEDRDYLYIKAIQDLTNELKRLNTKNG